MNQDYGYLPESWTSAIDFLIGFQAKMNPVTRLERIFGKSLEKMMNSTMNFEIVDEAKPFHSSLGSQIKPNELLPAL